MRTASSYPRFKTHITFPQIDWAGRIFYSRVFEIAQAAMEQFMTNTDLGGLTNLLKTGGPLPVIVHAESDFRSLIELGDELTVEISCIRIGNTSFTLCYDMWKVVDNNEVLAAQAKVTHVLVVGNQKTPIPPIWKEILEGIHGSQGDE